MVTIIVFVAIIILAALYAVGAYNGLVRLRTLAEEGWSGIDVFLKKRYDLIPNLVETVKGYAAHEKETFENVTKARAGAMAAKGVGEQEVAENNLNKALMNLYAVAEQYPDLKANANFMNLQNQIESLEGEIEKSRRYYNGTVREYNVKVETFPSNIIANMFAFVKKKFFELTDILERETPKVQF
jgi:LemA protein